MCVQELIKIATTSKIRRRGEEAVLFAMNLEQEIMELYDEVCTHTYTPLSFAFITFNPTPREIIASRMKQLILDAYLSSRISPLIEEELTPRVFNNRKGLGSSEAINQVISDIYDVSNGFTRDAWVIKYDFKGYFPNALQDIIYAQISDLVDRKYSGYDKDFLHSVLKYSVFSYPTDHCEKISPLVDWEGYPRESMFNKMPGVGISLGREPSQDAMKLYVNHIDKYIIAQGITHLVRYVDDTVIVTDCKEGILQLMPKIREMAADVGCSLHPKKFYCQHYSRGVEFLGSFIKKDRVYIGHRTVRHCRAKVQYYNTRVRVSNLEHFMASMNSYLGLMKGRNAHNIILDIIGRVNPKWWEFCHFNPSRVCIQANEGYTVKDMITKRYGVKFKTKKKNDNKRKNRSAGGRKTRAPRKNGSF